MLLPRLRPFLTASDQVVRQVTKRTIFFGDIFECVSAWAIAIAVVVMVIQSVIVSSRLLPLSS
jgi:hypothetical protein